MLTHNDNEAESELISKSRNLTMVYTCLCIGVPAGNICDSRNFTMVYTKLFFYSQEPISAIAEILLWFTPS